MKTLETRINTLEEKTGTGKGEPPIVIFYFRAKPERFSPEDAPFRPAEGEDVATWITYKRWCVEKQAQDDMPRAFEADPVREAQTRRKEQLNHG